jgi:O-antigen ligase
MPLVGHGAPRQPGAVSVSPQSRRLLRPVPDSFAPVAQRRLAAPALVGLVLLVRVLTDDRSPPDSRHTAAVNLSVVIAALIVAAALAVIARSRGGVRIAALCCLWLGAWTLVAVVNEGLSGETLREGVREGSVVALGVIVYNARESFSVPVAARLVQFVTVVPALLALHQFAAGTGMHLYGEWRPNGTLAHPDSAAMLFAVACAASAWCWLELGQHALDALLTVLLAAAVAATGSIDGTITLLTMLVALAVLRPRPSAKLAPLALAALVALAFLATPLGSYRAAGEARTNPTEARSRSSLSWRFHKWSELMSEWKRSPVLGGGLGTTLTQPPRAGSEYAGKPPHNEYVRYLVETGIVGLALLALGLAFLLRRLIRATRAGPEQAPGAAQGAKLAIVIILGCLVNALADNTLTNSPTCYVVVLIVAAALALPAAPARRARAALQG